VKKFFIEGNEYSMMRLLSFLSVVSGIIVSGFIVSFVFTKTDLTYIREMILLSGTFLGFGFGGKVLQKFSEKNK
jgi:hypothetical protein